MKLPLAFAEHTNNINVIIETPKGSGNKYSFDNPTGLFKLSKVLPEGMVFPSHFGFIPGTRGGDGDPLDVLVLMDENSYPGILIECKVIGIIEAEQTEESGETIRNDRILAASAISQRYSRINSLKNLDKHFLEELTKFFIAYNAMNNKKFTPIAYWDASKAIEIIKKQIQ